MFKYAGLVVLQGKIRLGMSLSDLFLKLEIKPARLAARLKISGVIFPSLIGSPEITASFDVG